MHGKDVAASRALDGAGALAPMGGRTFHVTASPARAFGADVFKHLDKAQMRQLAYHLAGIRKWESRPVVMSLALFWPTDLEEHDG